ncbi:MAG TPA: hypothetical protein VH561_09525 [Micromonosporaceae bacterium]|jgi:hypothetical protein
MTISRDRLERFARRQRLDITPDNGNQVIRYLAVTRRWRVWGFIGGVIGSQLFAPPGTIVKVDFVTIFAGWFVGALVAEVRVSHLAYGSIRTASLQPRRAQRYVRGFAWALVPASAGVALAVAAATFVAGLAGWADPAWPWAAAWLAVALAVAGGVWTIQHAVLRRPQPLAAADVIEADDAIRSRSLHVLCGGGAALVLFLVFNQLGALHPTEPAADQIIAAVRLIGVFVVTALGWGVATSVWPASGTDLRAGAPAVGAV